MPQENFIFVNLEARKWPTWMRGNLLQIQTFGNFNKEILAIIELESAPMRMNRLLACLFCSSPVS